MKWMMMAMLVSGCGRVAFDARSDGASGVVPDAPFEPANCPATYSTTLGGSTSRYRNLGATALWPDAVAHCAADSPGSGTFTHLVVISDDVERVAVNQLRGVTQNWVGMSDRITEGTFVIVTDEDIGSFAAVVSPPWQLNEPNDQNGEDCGELNPPATSTMNSAPRPCSRSFASATATPTIRPGIDLGFRESREQLLEGVERRTLRNRDRTTPRAVEGELVCYLRCHHSALSPGLGETHADDLAVIGVA